MSDYSITNHIQYKEHMKGFISKKRCNELIQKTQEDIKKQCNSRLSKVQSVLAEQRNAISQLDTENAKLREQLRALLKRCPVPQPPPPKPQCPIIPLDQHPDYIEIKKQEAELRKEKHKAELTKLDADKCPEVVRAKRKLDELRKQCSKPKHNIKDHPDYQSLMERHRQEVATAQSKTEAETRKKLRTDIRNHPDYHYFKAYYESEIANLKKKLTDTTCAKCPECLECPACPPETSSKLNQPQPYSQVPTINPHANMGSVHFYDKMLF